MATFFGREFTKDQVSWKTSNRRTKNLAFGQLQLKTSSFLNVFSSCPLYQLVKK